MFASKQFRAKAAESAEAVKSTAVPSEIRGLPRSQQSLSDLAQSETRLAHNFEKTIRSPGDNGSVGNQENAVADIEEYILRCLGAAVIMQWSTIPTKLQRELFDTAGSLGDVRQTPELRGQIASFLHDHKNKENSEDCSSGLTPKGKPERA